MSLYTDSYREPLRQEGLFFYRSAFIVLLPSGSGFVLVREGFEGFSALFSGSREGDSQIFEVFRSFFEEVLAPLKHFD